MANVQRQFIEFDDTIRLKRYGENATLREKRDRVLQTLSDGIAAQREDGEEIPSYRTFDQGSYDLGLGIQPLDCDFDIDEGVAFELTHSDHGPVDVKNWVFKAVDGHTERVEMRGPCVTVFYQSEGEPLYHVDLAVYAEAKGTTPMMLARGKPTSDDANRNWTPSDPEGLTDALNRRFSGDDASQYRRATRDLKRWKDEQFSADGNGAPRGIAIAVAGFHWFSPATRSVDGKQQRDDLQALRNLVGSMLSRFTPRLVVRCPTEPYDDLCARMTDKQMNEFKTKLEALLDALREAADDTDPHTACKTLALHFGSDFPVPEKEETAKPQRRAITSSGNSG